MRKVLSRLLPVLVVALIATSAFAEVKPNSMISDNAVLQRGINLPIWGTADKGEKVTVQFQGQTVSAVAENGWWMVRLKPLKAGGPFTMKINDQEIKNLLVGEVWVCSGQSNMAFQLKQASNATEAIAAAKDPMIRLYAVPKMGQPFELPKAWTECTPETVPTFSAVGYFFGKHLRETLKVPVGLIDSSVGGTPAESWTSRSCLSSVASLKGLVETRASGWGRVAYLYNAMIAPLQPYGIKGAIWYQGEANAGSAYQYRTLLPTMIKCWRDNWGEGDFPFLIVQLAPFAGNMTDQTWPELREAQLLTAKNTPNTAMAVITDVGEEMDIHPKQKEPVGYRLGLAAQAIAYGQKVEFNGPVYKSMKIDGNKIALSFDHVGGGLVAKGGDLTGFTIAGADQNFVAAKAEIKGDKIVVSSPDVAKPVAVRYGWTNWMVVNLWNKAGLPATPFRTDDFQMLTQPK